jgi:short-subunit dehydrogenase
MMSSQSLGTALITGASSGIGAVYADRLAQRGYDLLLVARNAGRLTALAAEVTTRHNVRVETISADLANVADLDRVEQRLRSDAAITLLVNNAGLMSGGPLSAAKGEDLDSMLQVNVVALTRLSAAAAASFSPRGHGAIINIGSAMAYFDTASTAAYGASKAYVLNFSLSLDVELKEKGVKVQAVLPGYTRTPMIGNAENLPDSIVMNVEDLVDAALAGFDAGELVTIPSLADPADFANWENARASLRPNLSLNSPAPRYGVAAQLAS